MNRVADALLASISDSDVPVSPPELPEDVLKKVAARLDEADLRRLLEPPLVVGFLPRVILNELGSAKNRTFPNTWDYLDWIEANRNGVLAPKT